MPNFIDIHSHSRSNNRLSIVNLDNIINNAPEYNFSIGLHPWDISKLDTNEHIIRIKKITKPANCLAIGECGIDRAIDISIEQQKDIFLKQVEISNDLNKPIIIHCVKAYSDFIEILKTGINKTPWIFHSFNSNTIIAKKLIECGCYLSFGEQLINSKKLQAVFEQISINNLFFETDTSNINIEDIYTKAASIKHTTIDDIMNSIFINYQRVFNTSG